MLLKWAPFFCAALVGVLSASTVVAEEADLAGLWGFDGCGDVQGIEFQGFTSAAYFGDDGLTVIQQKIDSIENSNWLFASVDEDDAYPLLMRVDDEVLVQAWPVEKAETASAIKALHAALSSGSLNPDQSPEKFEIFSAEKCASLPLPHVLVLGEVFAILQQLDRTLWLCVDDVVGCPEMVFDVLDLTSDGELSVAEMSRFFRATVTIASAMNEAASLAEKSSVAIGATSIAPLMSAYVLHSLDYDRSGSISLNELFYSRLPVEFDVTDDQVFDLAGFVEFISDVSSNVADFGTGVLR